MNQLKWYAAYTYPRHEKKASTNLSVVRSRASFLVIALFTSGAMAARLKCRCLFFPATYLSGSDFMSIGAFCRCLKL